MTRLKVLKNSSIRGKIRSNQVIKVLQCQMNNGGHIRLWLNYRRKIFHKCSTFVPIYCFRCLYYKLHYDFFDYKNVYFHKILNFLNSLIKLEINKKKQQ